MNTTDAICITFGLVCCTGAILFFILWRAERNWTKDLEAKVDELESAPPAPYTITSNELFEKVAEAFNRGLMFGRKTSRDDEKAARHLFAVDTPTAEIYNLPLAPSNDAA